MAKPDAPVSVLPAVQRAYDVCRWLIPVVERFPRKYKFTIGDRLVTTALDLELALVEASHAKRKERSLFRAQRLLDQLRLLLRLAHDLGILRSRQLAHVGRWNEELGRMMGGWLRWARQDHAPATEERVETAGGSS